MTSASPSISSNSHTTMDMDSSMMGSGHHMMNMFFSNRALNYPVLFEGLKGKTNGQVAGIVILIIVAGIFHRFLVYVRDLCEHRYWAPLSESVCEGIPSNLKPARDTKSANMMHQGRDLGRVLMTVLTAIIGYSLMLITMTFVVPYFFAAVIGLGIGEAIFARFLPRGKFASSSCCA